jgi:hypothetical protein
MRHIVGQDARRTLDSRTWTHPTLTFWQLTHHYSLGRKNPWGRQLATHDWIKIRSASLYRVSKDSVRRSAAQGSSRAWWASYTAALSADHHVPWDNFRVAFHGHHLSTGTMHHKHSEIVCGVFPHLLSGLHHWRCLPLPRCTPHRWAHHFRPPHRGSCVAASPFFTKLSQDSTADGWAAWAAKGRRLGLHEPGLACSGDCVSGLLWAQVQSHFPFSNRFSIGFQFKFKLGLILLNFCSNLVFQWVSFQTLNSNRKSELRL